MIYYGDKKIPKIKKYRSNIQKNNQNYSIILSVVQEKLQISLKFSNNYSDEIFEYTNFYSFHQLQIINKYFRKFDNLEQISRDLDKKIKKNNVSIEEKNGFIILSITVLIKNETSTVIFKLLQNKIMDNRSKHSRIKNTSNNYKGINNYSVSMPKYDVNNTKKMKNMLNDLNDRVSMLESNQNNKSLRHGNNYMNRYASMPKENVYNNYINNNINSNMNMNNNDQKILLNNMNTILTRINKLEDINKEKEKRIKELENEVNQYEANLSSSISYPLYGPLLNKSEISNSEIYVNNNIIKHKKNNQLNISENKVDSGFINEYNNKSKEESSKILRNNKNNGSRYNNTSQRYAFKPIEENKEKIINNNIYSEEDEKNNYKDQENSNDSYKENNINNKLKGKKQLKNKSKTQSNIHKNKASNSSSIKDDEDSYNNKKRNKGRSYSSSPSQSEQNGKDSYNKKKKKKI